VSHRLQPVTKYYKFVHLIRNWFTGLIYAYPDKKNSIQVPAGSLSAPDHF